MTRKIDDKQLKRRYASERRFKALGLSAVLVAASFVFILLGDILIKSIPAFFEHKVNLEITLDETSLDPEKTRKKDVLLAADTGALFRASLQSIFPEAKDRTIRRKMNALLSTGAGDDLNEELAINPSLIGQKVTKLALLASDADLFIKEETGLIGKQTLTLKDNIFYKNGNELLKVAPFLKLIDKTYMLKALESDRRLNDQQAAMLFALKDGNLIEKSFNWRFFKRGDSREPELAGLKGAVLGSLFTLFITLSLCLPIGVAAAIYLQEFAPKNRITDFLEVNINNLAAVPSIVFGLLGLAIFLNFFGVPRSSTLVGGLVLSLLVLPTIIIATRTAIAAVPPSIKQAALGLGASHQQAIFHHILPLALPGIMTGTIMGIARALGETAPLLMIGMVAFIITPPSTLLDPATVLPVQIYLWSDLPEAGFMARTAAAIVVLLGVLFLLNALAIYLRNKFERRW